MALLVSMLALEDERDDIGEESRAWSAASLDRGKLSVSKGSLLGDTFR